MKRFSPLWLLLIVSLLLAQPVLAQNGSQIVLQPPDVTRFPSVGLTFEAYDAQGLFINDLGQSEVQVMENDQAVPVESLTRLQPGMHIIVAFNAAPTMGTAVANGPNRFDLIKKNLLTWMQAQAGNAPDELSLVTNAGSQATRVSGPARWIDALNAYTPDLAKTQVSLTSLTTALDLASDPSRKSNSKRAILYITAPLPDNNLAALGNLAERASQLGVHISVLQVPPAGSDVRSAKALADLAARTGGQFMNFTGIETLPSPESYFQSLRFLYRLTYLSTIRQTGDQRVQLALRRSGLTTQAEQRFSLNLQAPNPFFLSPPVSVQRTWGKAAADGKSTLIPVSVDLQMMVEFPDQVRRPLKAERLFVDGKLVNEITSEPFNLLAWPLEAYTSSGKHLLKIEIEDSFGFIQSSIEAPVDVQVQAAPALDLNTILAVVKPFLPYAGLGLAGLLLGVVGWLGLRALIRRRPIRKNSAPRTFSLTRGHIPVPIPALLRTTANPNAAARLARVNENNFSLAGAVFALSQDEMRLGSDGQGCEIQIEAATVDKIHARITHTHEGRYIIYDNNSVAGTWVNFGLVPPEGSVLEHGDQIHLGRELFRFELKTPPAPRQPKVTSIKEET